MKLSKISKWGISIVLLLVLAGTILSNYSAGIYLAIGAVILIGFNTSVRYWDLRRTLIAAPYIVLLVIVALLFDHNTTDTTLLYIILAIGVVIFIGLSISVHYWGLTNTVTLATFIAISLASIILIGYWGSLNLSYYLGTSAVILIGFGILIRYLGWRRALTIGVVLPFLTLIYALLGANSDIAPCTLGEVKSELELTGYAAKVEVTDLAEGSFHVSEHITYQKLESTCVAGSSPRIEGGEQNLSNGATNERWDTRVVEKTLEQDLPSRTIQSTKGGLFLHEVIILSELQDYECCPDEAKVEIKSLPHNSFYDAQYVNNLNVDEYLGNETITWDTSNLEDGLRFAYLPSPFYNARTLLAPVLDFSKSNNLILTAIGAGISWIFIEFISPEVKGFVIERLKRLLKRDDKIPQQKPPKRRLNRNQ